MDSLQQHITHRYNSLLDSCDQTYAMIAKLKSQHSFLCILQPSNLIISDDILINLKHIQITLNNYPNESNFDENEKLINILISFFRNNINSSVQNILLKCVEYDFVEGLCKLINSDEINKLDEDNNTLLTYATSHKYPSLKSIDKLLEFKADPFIECRFHETAFSRAIENNNLDLATRYCKIKIPLSNVFDILDQFNKDSDSKNYYQELTKIISDEKITNMLGLNSKTIRTIRLHIMENYNGLGFDSNEFSHEYDDEDEK